MPDFKQSLQMLGEWLHYLDEQEQELETKLARQRGDGGEEETAPPVQVIEGNLPSLAEISRPPTTTTDDWLWLQELVQEEPTAVPEPPEDNAKEVEESSLPPPRAFTF